MKESQLHYFWNFAVIMTQLLWLVEIDAQEKKKKKNQVFKGLKNKVDFKHPAFST